MRRTMLAMPLIVAVTLTLGACGDDDDAGESPTTTVASTEDTASDATAPDVDDSASSGEVPDPCAVLSADELAGLLGADQGAGSVNASDPDQRKVCVYETGLYLSVEIAANYEPSVQAIRDSGAGTVQDVTGVGEAAIWQEIGGGVGQLVALGDDYMIGVALGTGGQSSGEAVAEAMLAEL